VGSHLVTGAIPLHRIPQHYGAGLPGNINCVSLELGAHSLFDERDLVTRIVGVGEQEPEQAVVDELTRCPGESGDVVLPAPRVGEHHIARMGSWGRPERDRRERGRLDAETLPLFAGGIVEVLVRFVEPQQVFAFDVENEDAQVGGALPENVGPARQQS
jgi:hypothetical protein